MRAGKTVGGLTRLSTPTEIPPRRRRRAPGTDPCRSAYAACFAPAGTGAYAAHGDVFAAAQQGLIVRQALQFFAQREGSLQMRRRTGESGRARQRGRALRRRAGRRESRDLAFHQRQIQPADPGGFACGVNAGHGGLLPSSVSTPALSRQPSSAATFGIRARGQSRRPDSRSARSTSCVPIASVTASSWLAPFRRNRPAGSQ